MTPQWIGEPGVEAAVILFIDDLVVVDDLNQNYWQFDNYLQPIMASLQQIDKRTPISIMSNNAVSGSYIPMVAAWIEKGVSIEVHSLDHFCPMLLGDCTAVSRYYGSIDNIATDILNVPVAFRFPCFLPSPRFFADVAPHASPNGHVLTIDSSGSVVFASDDTSLPHNWTKDGSSERFSRYHPQLPAETDVRDLGQKNRCKCRVQLSIPLHHQPWHVGVPMDTAK